MAINRIIKLGLEEEAHRLKSQGLSDYEIARRLSELCGQKITQSSVWRYFNQNRDVVLRRVKHREEIVQKAINGRIDTVRQLLEINAATLAILEEAKNSGDLRTALRAIERIEKQLELQAKLLGDIQEAQTIVINVMRVES
jgi:predicted transcriptional regulator